MDVVLDSGWIFEHTSVGERKRMVEPDHSGLSVLQQCILLGLERSSFYYKPVGESEFNLMIMRIMDEIHLDYPYLLRGLDIVRPNQVWEMDITYIPNLHRAVLAQHKTRRHLSERLRGRSGVVARNRQLHPHLQHKKAAPES